MTSSEGAMASPEQGKALGEALDEALRERRRKGRVSSLLLFGILSFLLMILGGGLVCVYYGL